MVNITPEHVLTFHTSVMLVTLAGMVTHNCGLPAVGNCDMKAPTPEGVRMKVSTFRKLTPLTVVQNVPPPGPVLMTEGVATIENG
jgi:hypothetical protein